MSEGFRDENDERYRESLALIDKPKIQELFKGYYFDYQYADNTEEKKKSVNSPLLGIKPKTFDKNKTVSVNNNQNN